MKSTGRALAALCVAVGLLLALNPTPALASVGTCTASMTQRYPVDQMGAFAAHQLRTTAHVCMVGSQVRASSIPAVSFPDRFPGAGVLETVKLSGGPSLIAFSTSLIAWEFQVDQQTAHISGWQHFTYRQYYSSNGHKLCMYNTLTSSVGDCTGRIDW